jgi:hypothetical protein
LFRMCMVFYCFRHGLSCAEKWPSVSPCPPAENGYSVTAVTTFDANFSLVQTHTIQNNMHETTQHNPRLA